MILIEFYGLLSKNSTIRYNRKRILKICIIAMIGIAAVISPFVIVGILNSNWLLVYMMIGIFAFLALIALLMCIFPRGIIVKFEHDIRVIIENDEIAVATYEQALEHKLNLKEASGMDALSVDGYFITQHLKTISDVRKVIDYGEWYEIVFYGRKNGYYADEKNLLYCICQKDLIVTGTIEDFEKLFEGKIIRKHKKVAKE